MDLLMGANGEPLHGDGHGRGALFPWGCPASDARGFPIISHLIALPGWAEVSLSGS